MVSPSRMQVFLEPETAQTWPDYQFLMRLCPGGIPMVPFAPSDPPYEVLQVDWNRLSREQITQARAFFQQPSGSSTPPFTIPVDYIRGYHLL